MINQVPLSQPIRGEVDSDGRLIAADDALRRLHHRAGGQEGGRIAIPGLAVLADLTLRLKMRLSRAVRVADEDDDMELWVEAVPENGIARLNIVSWRAVSAGTRFGSLNISEYDLQTTGGALTLQFDTALRLLSAGGKFSSFLERGDFGRSASEVFQKLQSDQQNTAAILDTMNLKQEFASISVQIRNGVSMNVTGRPLLAKDGAYVGYLCKLLLATSIAADKTQAASPGTLFGRQLAPVLRQPLGRIIANAETIGSELGGPIRENYALYAKDIANAARHLLALIDDLGDLEAVEKSDFVTARDHIELGDIARRVAGLLALKAADHSILIKTPDNTQNVPAVAEFRRVLQILLNLVTNGIRYSPDGTEVIIEVATHDDFALITVSDEGPGIQEQDKEDIFLKFERLGRSNDGGSGLGLYISRHLARAMGGDLTVDTATGGGAKFILRLPTQITED